MCELTFISRSQDLDRRFAWKPSFTGAECQGHAFDAFPLSI
jgi:hypothetical protein